MPTILPVFLLLFTPSLSEANLGLPLILASCAYEDEDEREKLMRKLARNRAAEIQAMCNVGEAVAMSKTLPDAVAAFDLWWGCIREVNKGDFQAFDRASRACTAYDTLSDQLQKRILADWPRYKALLNEVADLNNHSRATFREIMDSSSLSEESKIDAEYSIYLFTGGNGDSIFKSYAPVPPCLDSGLGLGPSVLHEILFISKIGLNGDLSPITYKSGWRPDADDFERATRLIYYSSDIRNGHLGKSYRALSGDPINEAK
ncbi:MAG: hypothetical protein AAB425_11860 [Bdellovibrionota bacterium]